ncbi:MAG TPA: phage/plasmid primase, P4 family [Bryobacteraceae bacterium]|jgi:putative DNA primase/helicase
MPNSALSVVEAVCAAIGAGFGVIPLRAGSKKPAIKEWQKRPFRDRRSARRYFDEHPDANFAITTGAASGIVVIDVDGPKGKASLRKLIDKYDKLPKTVRVETPNGQHLYFRHPGGVVRNSAGKLALGIDVRGDEGYVVGAGSLHPDGDRYRYKEGRALGDVRIARMPGWLAKRLRKRTPTEPPKLIAVDDEVRPRVKAYCVRALELEALRVRNAPKGQRNDTLNRASFEIGQLLPYGQLVGSTARAQLSAAATANGLDDDEVQATIDSGVKAGEREPRKLPFSGAPKVPRFQPKKGAKSAKPSAITRKLTRLGETDADNATRLVERYRGTIMWTPGLGWLVYDGKRWVPDEHGKRLMLAVNVAKAIKREAEYLTDSGDRTNRQKFSKKSKNKPDLERMLDLARPSLAIDDDRLDRDPWLLNVANGTIDLKTSVLEPHDASNLITKIANVAYLPDAPCDKFKKFIRHITGGNKQLARYLKKAFGYSLTGLTNEQVLYFLFGPPGTGKSTILNLIRTLLGDYGKHTPTETLVVKHFDNAIPADLARLKGARMVTAIEASHHHQLDEAKIKGMTGGDAITARFMRQNFFEYTPEFKLWFASNYLPRVKVTDDGIWRRLVIIPFNAQVPKEARDLFLSHKLQQEAAGILAWAVRGALLWQKEGFKEVNLIEATKKAWRHKADTVRTFVQECCRISGPADVVQSSVLFARYQQWCTSEGETPCSTKMFKARLLEQNLTHRRVKKGSVWAGIKLMEN